MDYNEIREQLLAAGATEEALAKIDFAKIESIIDGASSIEGLCKDIKKAYPDFNESEFKKAIAENSKDSENAEDLSDADLEAVAGGSVGSWLNENKDWLIPVASIAVIGGIVGTGILMKNRGGAVNERFSTISESDIDTRRMSQGKPWKKHDFQLGPNAIEPGDPLMKHIRRVSMPDPE